MPIIILSALEHYFEVILMFAKYYLVKLTLCELTRVGDRNPGN